MSTVLVTGATGYIGDRRPWIRHSTSVRRVISRLFRTAFLAALGAAVFAAVRKLTKPGDPLPAPATPTGGPWPPLRPETSIDTPASTTPPGTGTVRTPPIARPEPASVPEPPATEAVTTPQSARPAPAEAPGEAEGPAPADPTKAEKGPAKKAPPKKTPAKKAAAKNAEAPKPAAPTPTEAVGAPTVVPEPDGTPVADVPTPGTPAESADPSNNPWAEAHENGDCPDGFPIKANLKSKIFHSPGQLNYDRTNPDRCYVDAAAAEADGLRAAKR